MTYQIPDRVEPVPQANKRRPLRVVVTYDHQGALVETVEIWREIADRQHGHPSNHRPRPPKLERRDEPTR